VADEAHPASPVGHLLRDGGHGCLLGFVTPMHGDKARGDGVEIEWD